MDNADIVTMDPNVTSEPAEQPLPIRAHHERFSEEGRRKAAEEAPAPDPDDEPQREGETAEQAEARHHSAQQRRDKATGEFAPGKKRHRAASQQASPEDVPRIRELTAKQRAAEEKAERLERELAEYRQRMAAPQQPIQEQRQPERPAPPPQTQQANPWDDPNDPKPKDDDAKYVDNYGEYLDDRAMWAGRAEARRLEFMRWQHHQAQQHIQTWTERANAVKAEHPDFEEVLNQANQNPAIRWHHNKGTPLDRYIQFAPSGPKLLYHLQTNPAELDSLNRMDGFQQMETLALLSQRLLSNTPQAAGSPSGAAPRAQIELAPKPSTPLRTEAQRVSSPPPTDGSLPIRQHAVKFKVGR